MSTSHNHYAVFHLADYSPIVACAPRWRTLLLMNHKTRDEYVFYYIIIPVVEVYINVYVILKCLVLGTRVKQ